MKIAPLFVIALTTGLALSCKKESKTVTPVLPETKTIKIDKPEVTATVNVIMNPKNGSTATGEISFSEQNDIVTMSAHFKGLLKGPHALHIHEKADCTSKDATSCGSHWNPTNKPHGKQGATTGFHKGDIGNFTVNAKGLGVAKFSTNRWCIGCGDPNKDLLDKAIVVHQGADDFSTQPDGATGKRVSCGIITNPNY